MLRHLAAALGPDAPVFFVDHPEATDLQGPPPGRLNLHTSLTNSSAPRSVTLEMSPWSDEDRIEYLLATHPGRCRPVMDRLKRRAPRRVVRGLPELWRVVLDEMSADDSICGIDAAIERFLAAPVHAQDWEAVGQHCLASVVPWGSYRAADAHVALGPVARLIRHGTVKIMLAARRLAQGLADQSAGPELQGTLPPELIDRTGALLACFPAAVERVGAMATSMNADVHAMAASLLHAAGTGWRPPDRVVLDLGDARLPGVQWTGIELPGSEMPNVDLRRAVLDLADLSRATLDRAALAGALLQTAKLTEARLAGADLRGADLERVNACNATFAGADLGRARFHGALLQNAAFHGADLTRASFLWRQSFGRRPLRCGRFTGRTSPAPNLSRREPARPTALPGDVKRRTLQRSRHGRGCDLEGLTAVADFGHAVLARALLTGAVLRGSALRAPTCTTPA